MLFVSSYCYGAVGDVMQPGGYVGLQFSTERKIKESLNPVLKKYCHNSCELVGVKVAVEEELGEEGDLGFESVTGSSEKKNVYVNKVTAEIQVDDMVSASNIARLEQILYNHLRGFGVDTSIEWRKVQLPNIGEGGGQVQNLKDQLEQKLQKAVQSVISSYCPTECILAQVNIEGSQISPELAKDYPLNRIVTDPTGRSIMRIDDVDLEVTIDAKLGAESRGRIASLLKAKTSFAAPLNLNISVTEFPETYTEKMNRLNQNSEDPYGLEKLKRTLTLFKELAGTKEIITTQTSTSKEESNSISRKSESEKVSARQVDSSQMQNYSESGTLDYVMYIGGALLLAGLLIALFMRVLSVSKEAKNMVQAVPGQVQSNPYQSLSNPANAGHETYNSSGQMRPQMNLSEHSSLRMRVEDLKSEIIRILMENNRVARETFGRMLKEEGVEDTAKYIKILGQMVIIELLDDPNLQRDLYSLSEFYHNSNFDFELKEEYELLQKLKTKITASEIRVLTRKSLDKFDFLSKLDSEQIYNLVADETPQVQSIVLTQLDRKRRLSVFNMYQGRTKMSLMSELCKADAIPKEYLSNVALALGRKVSSRPEFDTQNLRSSEVLVDLMERADLGEQRKLMSNLIGSNPEAARGIKMRLVTIELMPFMKDGHLLEIILDMERDELLGFLKGTREHIRDLLLRKAPPELADSWIEDLNYMAGVDESSYRMAEMNVLRRIRNLASNGAIRIMEINEMIFSDSGTQNSFRSSDDMISDEFSTNSQVA